MEDVTTNVLFEQRTSRRGFIDVTIADAKTIIEQKSLGVDLDKPEERQGVMVTPFEQARNYANTLLNSQRPDYIIVCDFNIFRIHNLNKENPESDYIEFTLSELPDQLYLLDFLIDPQRARIKREEKVSITAGTLIGRLYSLLRQQYIDPDSSESQHSLNVLCVRLVFCLFAEDAELFEKDAFYNYLKDIPASHIRSALQELFQALNTPVDQRDPYSAQDLLRFPYVNGGLFAQEEVIPHFTDEIKTVLLDEVSQNTNWSSISPTIFGGVFESTLNPETRAHGGMHYTSPENIHKVIDPLFLDSLKAELEDILEEPGITKAKRKRNLNQFHDKLASLTFFDPACGSGNFLTETYISLRRLENKVLSVLADDQTSLGFDDINASPLKISLDQFFGLEINDFAVSVASTALWIAQLQANREAEMIITRNIEDLPLHDAAHIHQGNALRFDWNNVLPAKKCSYVIGNPPFLGYSRLGKEQKEDRLAIFGKPGGVLDYVACWYRVAANYMQGTTTEAAFVSTNSICQGQQVTPLWKSLFEMGIHINFAHRTFTWSNESADQAHVYCVIVGFSYVERAEKFAWNYPKGAIEKEQVKQLNGYLADAASVFLERRSKPLCDVPMMNAGGKPTEGGFLLMTPEERDELVRIEPEAEQYIRKFSMGEEFIKGKDRYCLWLVDCPPQKIAKMPAVRERVLKVKEMREKSTKAATRKKAETPWLFDEIRYQGEGAYIGVPKVSSERRKYIPAGFVTDGMIPGDKLYFIPTDSLFIFGIFMSQFHNAWMRVVGGRLKSDYSYGNTTVYNNFIWPHLSKLQKKPIEECAQAVIDARVFYGGTSLADLYNPENEFAYPALVKAHCDLDKAVEAAYGVDFDGDEQKIVAHLFDLYAQKNNG
jgi:putative DNA (cytosine-5-)-methyltransferase